MLNDTFSGIILAITISVFPEIISTVVLGNAKYYD